MGEWHGVLGLHAGDGLWWTVVRPAGADAHHLVRGFWPRRGDRAFGDGLRLLVSFRGHAAIRDRQRFGRGSL